MGKGGAHFGNLEEIKNALGEAAYEQVKAILDEEERRKRDHPGGGGVLDRTAIRDGVVERLAEFEASIEDINVGLEQHFIAIIRPSAHYSDSGHGFGNLLLNRY